MGSRPRLNHNEKVIKIVIGSGQGATSRHAVVWRGGKDPCRKGSLFNIVLRMYNTTIQVSNKLFVTILIGYSIANYFSRNVFLRYLILCFSSPRRLIACEDANH